MPNLPIEYETLYEKYQEILEYLKTREPFKATYRDIIANTSINSIGSVHFGIATLIRLGMIERTARSSYRVTLNDPTCRGCLNSFSGHSADESSVWCDRCGTKNSLVNPFNPNGCTIAEHLVTDDGSRCLCGYFSKAEL